MSLVPHPDDADTLCARACNYAAYAPETVDASDTHVTVGDDDGGKMRVHKSRVVGFAHQQGLRHLLPVLIQDKPPGTQPAKLRRDSSVSRRHHAGRH